MQLYAETVSDAYLPENLQVAKKSARLLLNICFKGRSNNYPNYHRTYRIGEDDEELLEIAHISIWVLRDVYQVSERANLKIQLDLGDDYYRIILIIIIDTCPSNHPFDARPSYIFEWLLIHPSLKRRWTSPKVRLKSEGQLD